MCHFLFGVFALHGQHHAVWCNMVSSQVDKISQGRKRPGNDNVCLPRWHGFNPVMMRKQVIALQYTGHLPHKCHFLLNSVYTVHITLTYDTQYDTWQAASRSYINDYGSALPIGRIWIF